MLSFKEYEFLHNLEEIFEQFEIKSMLEKRMKTYNSDLNIPWDLIREDL